MVHFHSRVAELAVRRGGDSANRNFCLGGFGSRCIKQNAMYLKLSAWKN